MNMKRWIPILFGIVLIAFGVGIFSLIYNDNFKISNTGFANFINVNNNGESVKIGANGIEVIDGNEHVKIDWKGIKVRDGNETIEIGWDGIRVNDGKKSKFKFGGNWSWFGIKSRDLKWESVNVEEFLDIDGVNNINISTPFIDVKVTEQDRENVRIHYYGSMKTNVIPSYSFKKNPNGIINIKLEIKNANNYSVNESDVALEVFIPKDYNGKINTTTSSGDIYMRNIAINNIDISSSSGDLELENLEGNTINIATSSGDVEIENSIGEIIIASSSGDISLDNEKLSGNIKISTSSGDVSINFSDDASYIINGTTSSGDFITDTDMKIEKNDHGRFEATIGSGEKNIEISTSSGDVYFR